MEWCVHMRPKTDKISTGYWTVLFIVAFFVYKFTSFTLIDLSGFYSRTIASILYSQCESIHTVNFTTGINCYVYVFTWYKSVIMRAWSKKRLIQQTHWFNVYISGLITRGSFISHLNVFNSINGLLLFMIFIMETW